MIAIHSIRAQKSRIAKRLGPKLVQIILALLVVTLFLLGGSMAATGQDIGYILLAPAILALMYLQWFRQYLDKLPVEPRHDITGVLERRVLAEIKTAEPSAQELWQALKPHTHTRFFALRFGLHPDLLGQMFEQNNTDMEAAWKQAGSYKKTNAFETLNAACLLVALFKCTPGRDGILVLLKLDMEEVESGLGWLAHIEGVFRKSTDTNGGGVARDWSAGYTPILSRLGTNISMQVGRGGMLHRPIEAHQAVIEQMTRVISQKGRSNVALVGEVGVGKTTTVYALAERLILGKQKELRFHQVFELDASRLLSTAKGRGELEGLLYQIVAEAHHAKNIILFFDEAQLFLHDGPGSVDLTNILITLLQKTDVRFIFAMTPSEWQRISATSASFTGMLNYQLVAPSNKKDTFQVMEDQALLIESKHQVLLSYSALREAYRLADHYVSDESFPGKALKLVEQAAVNAGKNSLITEAEVQKTLESTRGIKLQAATTEESNKLLNLEDEVHKQMINQSDAVHAVSNALRRARAGVRNTNRPIGAFLFLGPTGVGKTQLAKALADVYFGGADQLVRVDMNEYVTSNDLNRLLATQTGESTNPTFLSKIRQQPFSVVLLDEIEKAHPDVINALLQLLDEGRMTDVGGREASFKDAIIIATSNAGADKIREYISAGQQLADFREPLLDNLIESGQFKPEFLNRFDEMVIFRPLTEDELLEVVSLMLNDINKTLSNQRISISLDEEAKRWLVRKGNDPRLGARPMRRIIQRYIEDTVAKRVLEGTAQAGTVITLTAQDFETSAA